MNVEGRDTRSRLTKSLNVDALLENRALSERYAQSGSRNLKDRALSLNLPDPVTLHIMILDRQRRRGGENVLCYDTGR